MTFEEWARKWAISPAALADLRQALVADAAPLAPRSATASSEASVQATVRLDAARQGIALWRNNVGATLAEGRMIRYGLANDSRAVNASIKSADLIGIRPRLIVPADVGTTIGQFVSRECKASTWVYTGNVREAAQLRWAQIVTALGGDAAFSTGAG